LPAIDVCAVDIGAEGVGIEPDRPIEIGESIVGPIQGLIDQAAAEISLRQLRIELYGLVLVLEGLGQIAGKATGFAPVQIGRRRIGIELCHLVEISDGELVLAEGGVDCAPIQITHLELGLEANGRLLICQRLVVVALQAIGLAAIAESHGRAGIERDGRAEILDRLRGLAGMEIDGAAVVMRRGKLPLALSRRGDHPRAGGDDTLHRDRRGAYRFVAEIGIARLLLSVGGRGEEDTGEQRAGEAAAGNERHCEQSARGDCKPLAREDRSGKGDGGAYIARCRPVVILEGEIGGTARTLARRAPGCGLHDGGQSSRRNSSAC